MILKSLKKKLYILLNLFCSLVLTTTAVAQVTINIPESNIRTQSDYTAEAIGGPSLNGLLSLVPTINIKSNLANFPISIGPTSIPSVPLNRFFVKIYSIGSLVLLGSSTEQFPSNTEAKSIYGGLASVSPGPIKSNYRIQIGGYAWHAGTFSNTIVFSLTGLLGSIGSPNQLINIAVPPFITTETTTADIALNVTSLDQFRSTGVTANGNLNYFTTVNTNIRLKSTAANFSFNKTYPNLPVPVNASTLLNVKIPAFTAVNPNTTDQNVATSVAVPIGNKNVNTPTYTITAANLKTNFIQAGIYTLPITYSIPPVTTNEATTASVSGNTTINVASISELIVSQPAVKLIFGTTNDYKNGVSVTVGNHLSVSSTVPYDITVKASGANLTSASGNTLPVNLIRIEGGAGQAGVTPITLSATAQKIVSASAPAIDRQLSIKYSIPSAQAAQLLNKAGGDYTTTVTYTIVAP